MNIFINWSNRPRRYILVIALIYFNRSSSFLQMSRCPRTVDQENNRNSMLIDVPEIKIQLRKVTDNSIVSAAKIIVMLSSLFLFILDVRRPSYFI